MSEQPQRDPDRQLPDGPAPEQPDDAATSARRLVEQVHDLEVDPPAPPR